MGPTRAAMSTGVAARSPGACVTTTAWASGKSRRPTAAMSLSAIAPNTSTKGGSS